MQRASYTVDPADPRAPPQDIWDRLSEEDRRRIVAALPSEPERAAPPEGDPHLRAKTRAREALEEYYRRIRRKIYISAELPVYYPSEAVFAPDLLAVRDVEGHERMSWVVSAEKRGLDFVLEIHVSGSARKDFEDNVERYARLEIPEYFAFDPIRGRLSGWRLAAPRKYEPIVPQGGRWASHVLELDLALAEGRLRFMHGSAPLLDASELIAELSKMVDDALRRADEERHRAEAESRRAEEESRRAEEESRRAERLAERLRKLGLDPDSE